MSSLIRQFMVLFIVVIYPKIILHDSFNYSCELNETLN